MISFFEKMSDFVDAEKLGRKLNRKRFKDYLKTRYSNIVGERIILFIESTYSSLHNIDFDGFL